MSKVFDFDSLFFCVCVYLSKVGIFDNVERLINKG